MSVKEAQEKISSKEFSEWMAYDLLEPFGGLVHDYREATMCYLTAKMAGISNLKIEDFLLNVTSEKIEIVPKMSKREAFEKKMAAILKTIPHRMA